MIKMQTRVAEPDEEDVKHEAHVYDSSIFSYGDTINHVDPSLSVNYTTIANPFVATRTIPSQVSKLMYCAGEMIHIGFVLGLSSSIVSQHLLARLLCPQLSMTHLSGLSSFLENKKLQAIASRIAERVEDSLRSKRSVVVGYLAPQVRQFHIAVAEAAAGSPPSSGSDSDEDDYNNNRNIFSNPMENYADFSNLNADSKKKKTNSALEIAEEIAKIYYSNLELDIKDIEKVLRNRFGANTKNLTEDFIKEIVHTRVDKARYELLSLLPAENIIALAVSNMKGETHVVGPKPPSQIEEKLDNTNDLDQHKKQVIAFLEKYISRWKLSLFGHHHNDRAKYLKSVIQKSTSAEEIKRLLQEQVNIMEGNIKPELKSSWSQSSLKKNPNSLVTLPNKLKRGGYLKVINDALSLCNNDNKVQGGIDYAL